MPASAGRRVLARNGSTTPALLGAAALAYGAAYTSTSFLAPGLSPTVAPRRAAAAQRNAAPSVGSFGAVAGGAVGALFAACAGSRSWRSPIQRRVTSVGGEGDGDIEDLVPFELRGFSLAQVVLALGFALLGFCGYDYATGGVGGSGISALFIIYAVPILLLGGALAYAELAPVEVETEPQAERLFEEKATTTLRKIKSDVTRHRYGDDAHLEGALKTLGLTIATGRYPQLKRVIESKAANGELEFTMLFQSKDVPFTMWKDPAKIPIMDRFFGPGVWSEVSKYSSEDKIAALKLTTGARPVAAGDVAEAAPRVLVSAAALPQLRQSSASTTAATLAGATLNAANAPRRQVRVAAAATESPGDEVNRLVAANKVMVFSKSWCPFCKKAKKALTAAGADFVVMELDERGDGDAIQDALLAKTGGRSVPRVFLNGEFIGGGDDMVKLQKKGELEKMVA